MTVNSTVAALRSEYDTSDVSAAHLLCDRHPAERVAFRIIGLDGEIRDLTFGELGLRSRRMAAVLCDRGVQRGDRVPVMMHKSAELIVTLVAIWRLGAVHVPLFTAFSHGAVATRVAGSAARVAVTEADQRSKLDGIEGLEVLDIRDLDEEISRSPGIDDAVAVGGDGALVQLFTSGTTGNPKAVVVPVRALASFHSYLIHGMDVREDDLLWNMADPGWAYGLYCGVLGPLAAGVTNVLMEAPFTPDATAEVLKTLGVTNFAAAPTVYRALRASADVSGVRLRRACSAGEPLPADVFAWARDQMGVEVLDHYGQTEVGMIVANSAHPDLERPPRAGSMGLPLPGFSVDVLDGQIAVDTTASPLMWFTGYVDEPELTAQRFTSDERWYLTGDTGRSDPDGFVYFESRDDDVILAAGYRIGPFEIENALSAHPQVADVAVVGQPDPDGVRGEIVVAFVVLSKEVVASAELKRELQDHVRTSYSRHAYPRRVEFVQQLPRTPSGKVQRYLLRER
ncbi:AMP-binding protein [Aeromicrobium sp. P5_D10]